MIYTIIAFLGFMILLGGLTAWGIRLCILRSWGRGITIGLAGLVLLALSAGIVLLPARATPQEGSRRTRCMSNLSQIGKAMKMYSMDHDEAFPSSFLSLTNYGCSNPKLFICPCSGKTPGAIQTVDDWSDYILVTNLTESSPSACVQAYCKPGNHRDHKGINALLIDGAVLWCPKSDLHTLSCDVLMGSRISKEPRPGVGR